MRRIRLLGSAAATLSLFAHNHCHQTFTRPEFHQVASHIFDRSRRATAHERHVLHTILRCQRYRKSLPILRFHLDRYRRHHDALLRIDAEWRYIRSHPMPYCTWGPESGGDYTARNSSSTAGGKYQILASTWYAYGGSHYNDSHPAAVAPPLEQERVARRVLASQGLGAWVNCP